MTYAIWFHRKEADFWNKWQEGTFEEVLSEYFDWKNGKANNDADAARIEVTKHD